MALQLQILLLTSFFFGIWAIRGGFEEFLRLPSEEEGFPGQKWALLIAGSSGYYNYRHQADICHAYQILRKNGIPDDNIVVFMADDIASHPENPYPGTIFNSPNGKDVYANVPKDYTGWNVTVGNFLAALKGDKARIRGGSGKVIASGPQDHVFVFYSDHGGPGILGMPTYPFLYADQIVNALIEKHEANGYQRLVFYLEACESGSIFEGLLPPNIDVYATTASNSEESSWGTYCPGMNPSPPEEFETCLGDLYSVAWMEDSEAHNLAKESLNDQYLIVKERTSNQGSYNLGSHVMQFGDMKIHPQKASLFLGTDPANKDAPPGIIPRNKWSSEDELEGIPSGLKLFLEGQKVGVVPQRDADLLHFWHKYKNAPEGSVRKSEALREISEMTTQRAHVDSTVNLIGQLLSENIKKNNNGLTNRAGKALVDDWNCLRLMVESYEKKCGLLTQYGMKHTSTFAQFCNNEISPNQLEDSASLVCGKSAHYFQL